MRPFHLVLAVTVAAALTACHGGEPDPLAGWAVPGVTWGGCPATVREPMPELECATLAVPVDWAQPSGPSIDLTLARLMARSSVASEGVVLALSGGPGGSGIDDLPYVADALPEVWDHFDLLAHEPRTALALRTFPEECTRSSGAIMDIPGDSMEYVYTLEPLVGAIRQCRDVVENGLVDHLDGLSQALDVEAIRRAVGAEQLNLTAQSYGGVVVAAYARVFPSRIRAAYVDGVVSHPDYPFVRGPETQQREFERFAAWCSGSTECALSGEDVVALWLQLTEAANRDPIPARSDRFGEQALSGAQLHFLTPGWRNPGPDYAGWIQLSQDIDQARKGDASPFLDWAFGNLTGWASPLEVALQCPDGAEGDPGYRSLQTRMAQYRQDRPLFYGVKVLGMICEAWPLPVANPPMPLPGPELPPFLGAGTLANDFQGTAQLLEHIPGSTTIGVAGSGHAVYVGGATEPAQECVARYLTRYLIDLDVPPSDTQCAA